MPFTLRELLALPALRSRLVSGAAGLDRPVRWAHVCELPDPTEWLGEGDLLMSTGLGIPAAPSEQRRYVQRLMEAGLAGLMIGEDMQAPADLAALCDAAEHLDFPLVFTEYGVPFAAVTRAIADAGRSIERERHLALQRIYETARLSLGGLGLAPLLARLEKDVAAALHLIDSRTLAPWDEALPALGESAQLAIRQTRAEGRTGLSPMLQRYPHPDGEMLGMALPSKPDCLLVVRAGELPDYALLHHLLAIVGIELERMHVESERRLRLGSELLDDLLNGRAASHQAEQRLQALMPGLPLTALQLCIARMPLEDAPGREDILQRWGQRGLLRIQGHEIVLLQPAERIGELQAELGAELGASNPVERPERFADALREARLALAHAGPRMPLILYATLGPGAPWLPRSLDEAERTARQTLGPLLEQERAQGAPLLHSRRSFSKRIAPGRRPPSAYMSTSRPWCIACGVSKRSRAVPWTAPKTSPFSGSPCGRLASRESGRREEAASGRRQKHKGPLDFSRGPFVVWRIRRDSNPRPLPSEGSTLSS